MSLTKIHIFIRKSCKLAYKLGFKTGGENPFGNAFDTWNDKREIAQAFEQGKLARDKLKVDR